MRPPHPALHELYRQAAVPSQVMARLQRVDEALARFDPEVIAGGEGGDDLLIRLIRGLQFGELLSDSLARLESPAAPSAEGSLRFERPLPEEPSRRGETPKPRDARTVSKSVFSEAVSAPRRPPLREERRPQHDQSDEVSRGATVAPAPAPKPSLAPATSVSHARPAASHDVAPSSSSVAPAPALSGAEGSRRLGRETRPGQPPRRQRYVRVEASSRPRSFSPDDPRHDAKRVKEALPDSRREDSAVTHEVPAIPGHEPRRPISQPVRLDRKRDSVTAPTTQHDATAAHEILVARAESAGVTEALHQLVGREVPERIVFELRNHQPARNRSESEPSAEEPLQRLAAAVARVERVTRGLELPSAERVARDGVAALPPLEMHRAQRLSSPVGGLRGLVALAQLQPAPTTRLAAVPAHLASPPLPAFDEAELAARICELLRRDAERNGIDMTGVEP